MQGGQTIGTDVPNSKTTTLAIKSGNFGKKKNGKKLRPQEFLSLIP